MGQVDPLFSFLSVDPKDGPRPSVSANRCILTKSRA